MDCYEALYAVALAMDAGILSSSAECAVLDSSDVTLESGGNLFEFKMKGQRSSGTGCRRAVWKNIGAAATSHTSWA